MGACPLSMEGTDRHRGGVWPVVRGPPAAEGVPID